MNQHKERNMRQMQAGGSSATPAGKRVQRAWLAALLLAATSALTPAHAGDEESERANLARIESELAQIQQMVAAMWPARKPPLGPPSSTPAVTVSMVTA